jgi:hypothetical protein
MELILITNDPAMALHAQECGVHRIMVDLELIGKDARQGHLNTVISGHTTDDVHNIGKVLSRSKLQVRVNPLHEGSQNEIDTVIGLGADIVMLPMFTTANEAQRFVDIVGGRAKTQLLVETPQALVRIDDVVAVPGVDEIYIGLNDHHLGRGLRFMFELQSGGIIEYLAAETTRSESGLIWRHCKAWARHGRFVVDPCRTFQTELADGDLVARFPCPCKKLLRPCPEHGPETRSTKIECISEKPAPKRQCILCRKQGIAQKKGQPNCL